VRARRRPARDCVAVPCFERVKLQKNCIEVLQVVNRKVEDLTILYHFHKGRMVFFSTDFAQTAAKLECRHVSVDRRYWRLTKFFTNFLSKFEMSIYMKVVSLNKLDNFHIGIFVSV
jgi:hypothetical protein